ncbi:hypothetical protein OS493_004620 [Desmophyllum pertusum]|uniref:Uncharacterized protein n=1 Tax=Desmophyllum pertusum TaxID=174260 RepID=A0A9W9ZGQ9_9CNID|nr:hypothetical protein OS493_004620 [Desmophyllum pertusum]
MKMKIYVCKGSSDPNCFEGNKVIHGGWSDWSECEDGLQTRQCNNPASANGGLACVGPTDTLTDGETSTAPGLPSKENRTGDQFTNNGFEISKGLFVGICVIVLVVGITVGTLLGLLLFRMQRRRFKRQVKITRVPSALSRPTSMLSTISTISTVSESAKMVH